MHPAFGTQKRLINTNPHHLVLCPIILSYHQVLVLSQGLLGLWRADPGKCDETRSVSFLVHSKRLGNAFCAIHTLFMQFIKLEVGFIPSIFVTNKQLARTVNPTNFCDK